MRCRGESIGNPSKALFFKGYNDAVTFSRTKVIAELPKRMPVGHLLAAWGR